MVTDDRAVILDFGFAQERARASARRPGAPPDGGTPNYMSPERLRSGGASAEDDVYALGAHALGDVDLPRPRARLQAAREDDAPQIMFDVPRGLSIDEIKQIFRCLNEDPPMRPQARHMRFFNPTQLTTSPIQVPRERLDPGPAARPRADAARSRRARSRSSSPTRPTRPRSSGSCSRSTSR